MFDIFKTKEIDWIQDDLNANNIINNSKHNESIKKQSNIENNKRFPTKFNDAYSIRDGRSNKYNKDIAELFGNHLYTKEEMVEQIQKYFKAVNEEEKAQKEEEMRQWKEEKDLIEQIKTSQRTNFQFSSKTNNDNQDLNKEKFKNLFFNFRPSQKKYCCEENVYQEYLNFKN